MQKHSLTPRGKLLHTGQPGTGKTMTAQAIAGELGIAVYINRLDGLMSNYLEESIARLRLMFDAKQEHRAVYLFNEFDAIASTATKVMVRKLALGDKTMASRFAFHREKSMDKSEKIYEIALPMKS